jgi:hypothetical protein
MGMWHQGHISRTKKRSFGFVLLGFSGFRFRVFRFGVFGIGRENPNGQKKGKASVVVIVWERNFKALCLSLKSSKKRIAV